MADLGPPDAGALADALAGAWRLTCWRTEHVDGTRGYPLGRDAVGLLVYDPGGYMSGALMAAGRRPFAKPRLQAVEFDAGEVAELAEAFNSFLAYAGSWEISEDGLLRHHVRIGSIPGWAGTTLVREASVTGDRLILRTPPRVIDGMTQRGVLTWERAG